jgi:hypothetical protein
MKQEEMKEKTLKLSPPPAPDRIKDIWDKRTPFSGEWVEREDELNKEDQPEDMYKEE